MAKTYTPTLPTAKDWVRLQIADDGRGGRAMVLEDEEIEAIIASEKGNNRNLAAASCGELIAARAGNVIEKRVDDLEIRYGQDGNTAWSAHLQQLRETGASELLTKQSNFRVL